MKTVTLPIEEYETLKKDLDHYQQALQGTPGLYVYSRTESYGIYGRQFFYERVIASEEVVSLMDEIDKLKKRRVPMFNFFKRTVGEL